MYRVFHLLCQYNVWYTTGISRSSPPEAILGKRVQKTCYKFTGEHPCRSVISIKLLCIFIEMALWRRCYHVNLLHLYFIRKNKKNLVKTHFMDLNWGPECFPRTPPIHSPKLEGYAIVNLLGFNTYICEKVFKNRPSEICWKHSLKNLKWYDLLFLNTLSHLANHGIVPWTN